MASCNAGSSPLARGLLSVLLFRIAAVRIIPARAGFTLPISRSKWSVRDHPRSRGVYLTYPRVRFPCVGIIPARAGFTEPALAFVDAFRDHPRSRGVYSRILFGAREGGGSSPLARGLPVSGVTSSSAPRIIPARAGFTGPCRACPRPAPDHPRSRGVYGACIMIGSLTGGSSPLARGLLVAMHDSNVCGGIIPARAGFTG